MDGSLCEGGLQAHAKGQVHGNLSGWRATGGKRVRWIEAEVGEQACPSLPDSALPVVMAGVCSVKECSSVRQLCILGAGPPGAKSFSVFPVNT
eukprot:1156473-Pelagomonas_calceolata.AAC.5